jgi:hypothetical protein
LTKAFSLCIHTVQEEVAEVVQFRPWYHKVIGKSRSLLCLDNFKFLSESKNLLITIGTKLIVISFQVTNDLSIRSTGRHQLLGVAHNDTVCARRLNWLNMCGSDWLLLTLTWIILSLSLQEVIMSGQRISRLISPTTYVLVVRVLSRISKCLRWIWLNNVLLFKVLIAYLDIWFSSHTTIALIAFRSDSGGRFVLQDVHHIVTWSGKRTWIR